MSNRPNTDRPPRPFLLPKTQNAGKRPCSGAPASKGIGPNKACGRKGGIRRQGSKRG